MERRRKEKALPELPSLPIELITEILLRSPVKSVGRFRCVSKDFHSLLSDPKFAKNHLDLALRDNALRSRERGLILTLDSLLLAVDFDSISDDGSYPFKEIDYPFKNDRDYLSDTKIGTLNVFDMLYHCIRSQVHMVGSSNGLVCIYQKKGGVFLFNPTTGDSKRLPDLVDEERVAYGVHGFGFDAMNDDCKVIKFNNRKDGQVNANVYSLKTDSWRRIDNLRYSNRNSYFGVHLNGALHWIFRLEEEGKMKRVVLRFDLKTEEFREILLPDAVEECNHIVKRLELGSLKGCLCVSYNCDAMHDEMWVMNEYGLHSSWCRIQVLFPYMFVKPLWSTKNDEEVLFKDESGLVLYNFESKTWRSLELPGVKPRDWFDCITYVESLISPNSYGLGS